jgi:hypothetical protein
MHWNRLFALVAFLSFALVAGCGGGSSSFSSGGGGTGQVTVAVTDTPPANVTVLSFEVTITGAVLHSNTGKPDVVLVSSSNPIKIEVKRLETEAAFLNTFNVPADTYKDIAISLANPELTFENDTGATLAGCPGVPPNNVCEIKPAIAGTVTISSNPPFPLTVSGGSPTGLLVDININNILDNSLAISFSAAGGVTVTQLPLPGQPTGQLEEIEDLTGKVANKGTDTFDLQLAQSTITGIKVDATTQFEDFDKAGCAANNFTCVQNGQVVEVDLRLLAGGVLLGKKIELEDNIIDDEVEGVVFSIVSATQFKMVVVEELRDVAGVDVGNPITVNLQVGASFRVDTNGLTIPSGLQSGFEGASDTSQLLPGQEVQVRVRSLTAGPPITVSSDRVRLRMSRFTAKVAGPPAPPNFNVTGLPSLFTSNGITQIQVQTTSQTDFEGVSGVAALADGNTVSVRGLLFKASPNPILVADKVRKR